MIWIDLCWTCAAGSRTGSVTLCHGLRARERNARSNSKLLAEGAAKSMLTGEDRIRLIHDNRTVLLNRMFDELYRKSGWSAEQVSEEIVAAAQLIQIALANSEETRYRSRGLFVLALQQVVDSFIARLLNDDGFKWLAAEQNRTDHVSAGRY